MTDQEEPKTPSGPGEPEKPISGYLSPRLRAALEEADEPPKKSSPVGPILAVLALVIIAAGAWWLISTQQAKAKAVAQAAAAVEAARLAAEADSIARVRQADSLRAVAVADSIAAFLKLPRWKQDQLTGKAPPEEPDLAEEGSFVIDCGTFMTEGRAGETAAALKGTTALDVRVVPVREGGDTSFHVYAGKFSVRGAAQKAAEDLIRGGVAKQAKIITSSK